MALKFVIDKLEDVDAPLRAYYARVGEKYQLTTEGEHPKVTEFRSTNINQARELEELRPLKTKFEGVDPEEYRTLKAKAAAGDPADLVALRAELATEKAARAAAQARADALVLETTNLGRILEGWRPAEGARRHRRGRRLAVHRRGRRADKQADVA